MDREARARQHHALSDVNRLAILDELRVSDRSPSELLATTGLTSSLLAFHLGVLEDVGLVSRHPSQGDARRRYVTLDAHVPAATETAPVPIGDGAVLFVCSGNSARSQLAAAAWERRTRGRAASAGATPARRVHPLAVAVARRHGLDLSGARPRGYDEVEIAPALVVSVCDRAREAGLPFAAPTLHWSVPDPTAGGMARFEHAWSEISRRVDRLADAAAA